MGARTRMRNAPAAVLATGTGSAATASAATTGDRCSFDTASRTLDLAISSADDGASTVLVVHPDGVIEPRFYVPGRFDGTTAPVPSAPATPTVSRADLTRECVQGAGHPAGHWLRLTRPTRSGVS